MVVVGHRSRVAVEVAVEVPPSKAVAVAAAVVDPREAAEAAEAVAAVVATDSRTDSD